MTDDADELTPEQTAWMAGRRAEWEKRYPAPDRADILRYDEWRVLKDGALSAIRLCLPAEPEPSEPLVGQRSDGSRLLNTGLIDPIPGVHADVMVTVGGPPLPGCLWCGKVKPRDGWQSTCKGRVRIELREDAPQENICGEPLRKMFPDANETSLGPLATPRCDRYANHTGMHSVNVGAARIQWSHKRRRKARNEEHT